ncbi:MAG: histidine kinase dimerization/phospho-acceptor domain-containing protein [Acidobacteriota bacterium]|nr:histidine kinase dimerization/phospho-acceptor domain-containing protein [Acidobacteriota bacterium]
MSESSRVTSSDLSTHRAAIEKLGEVMRTLSVLTHKINNPLTALMGRAQLLRMGEGDPKVAKAAAVIEESAGRIAELIRELSGVVKEGREEGIEKLLALDVRAGSENDESKSRG